jgi:hypothetical protein
VGEGVLGAPHVSDTGDAYEKVVGVWADLTERAVEYADVWRSAIDRNGAGDYKSEDLLVDLQALWGMSIRDAARMGAAVIEAVAPLVPDGPFESDDDPDPPVVED